MPATPDTPPSPAPTAQGLAQRIRSAGHLFNGDREAIIAVLLRAPGPLDAEDIWQAVRDTGSRLHRATAYRTVTLLNQLEIIEVAAVRRRRKVYQIKRQTPTVHMVRSDTGAIQQINDASLLAALMDAARRHGYRLSGGVELRVAPLS